MSEFEIWNRVQALTMKNISIQMGITMLEAIEKFSAEYREKIPFIIHPPNPRQDDVGGRRPVN